jgi:hypothetical protein
MSGGLGWANPTRGYLEWSGEGRGCNRNLGWMVVDRVELATDGTVSAIDLRFAQHCEWLAPALHGAIHWRADDRTTFPGPAPIPADLWRAPVQSVPSGNYVYLESEPGDWLGGGQTYLYDSVLVSAGPEARIAVDAGWHGDFQAMHGYEQLAAGFYPDVQRYPFHNRAKGGMAWYGSGGCNTLEGWFAVDSIRYEGEAVTALDLRFEQHCEGAASALRGQIHYVAP